MRRTDEERLKKDNIIIFIGLCARAAVEGGLPIEVAKKMENQYVFESEK
ncbi:MAG: hypothetical protein ACERKZ_06490 [Lachnotalea sp.]